MRSTLNRCQLPAHNGSVVRVRVEVSEPGVDQQPRRIDLENLSFMLYQAHSTVRFLHSYSHAPLPAYARVHLEDIQIRSTTAYGFIAYSAEDPIGRRENINLADDRVVIPRNDGCSHESPLFYLPSLRVPWDVAAYAATSAVLR